MARMIIDGKKVGSVSGQELEVLSPIDGVKFATIPRGDKADVDLAVSAARRAVENQWKTYSATERGRLLIKLSARILEEHEELAQLEAKDTGKTLTTARTDITVLARYFEFYGGGADKIHGEVIPFMNEYNVQVIREPLGVTAHIIPWNYPAQMLGRAVAPALAMGNACVVKPAEDACLSVIRVAELALEVGFPPGVLNIVTGLGEEAGDALAKHPDINFVSFTGSNEVGVLVQQSAAINAVKCVLELGGKSAHVVFNDANFERAVPIIVKGIVGNTGQTCTAGSRLLVQKDVFDKFVSLLADEFSKVKVGSPEMDLNCGPVINKTQQNRIIKYIEQGKSEGLEVIAQGAIDENVAEGGYYVVPTLFKASSHESSLFKEEIFGPVLVVTSFETEEEAINLANDTDYGLMGAVWTENGGRQLRVAKGIKSGQIYINGFGAGGGVELPFGGVKRSGHGREKGFIALEELSTTKTIINYHG